MSEKSPPDYIVIFHSPPYHLSIYVQRAVHTATLAATSHTTTEWGEKNLDHKVLDQIITKLHIHGLEDWYLVPKSHIQLVEGSFKLLKRHEIFSFVISFPSSLFSSLHLLPLPSHHICSEYVLTPSPGTPPWSPSFEPTIPPTHGTRRNSFNIPG